MLRKKRTGHCAVIFCWIKATGNLVLKAENKENLIPLCENHRKYVANLGVEWLRNRVSKKDERKLNYI